MSKTKAQLRAEAVERLRDCRYHTHVDYVRAMLGWGHEPHFEDSRDALIDLLTDEEPESIQNGEKDKFDTREKLEADIERMVKEHSLYWIHVYIIEWLDRQAAITEHEILCHPDERDEQIAELQKQVDDLEEKYAELLSEKVVSDETCDIFAEKLEAEKKRCAELEAELDAMLGGGECEFIIEDNMNESEGMGDVWFRCTNCDTRFDYYADDWLMKQNYCPHCGSMVRKAAKR